MVKQGGTEDGQPIVKLKYQISASNFCTTTNYKTILSKLNCNSVFTHQHKHKRLKLIITECALHYCILRAQCSIPTKALNVHEWLCFCLPEEMLKSSESNKEFFIACKCRLLQKQNEKFGGNVFFCFQLIIWSEWRRTLRHYPCNNLQIMHANADEQQTKTKFKSNKKTPS